MIQTGEWRARINTCLNGAGPDMVFQPIFGLEPSRLVGYEALARFAEGNPHEWFTAANAVGLGYELEMVAAANALASLNALPPDAYMAVNVSPASVVTDGFTETMSVYDLSRVVLELTEHAAVADYAVLRGVLDPLRGLGAIVCTPVGPSSVQHSPEDKRMKLSVDDLGAGFASMRHVTNLAPDFMKLDLDLVRGVDSSSGQRAFVAAMVTFGSKMGVRVVAEGVETEAEFVTLRALDVYAVQGFHLGRPGPLP